MNLKALVDFCRKFSIIMDYKYDPRFGGGHTFRFMGESENGWIKLTKRIFDDDLNLIGSDTYCSELLDELKTDFVPKLKERNMDGESWKTLHV